jgi:hypothetical protein
MHVESHCFVNNGTAFPLINETQSNNKTKQKRHEIRFKVVVMKMPGNLYIGVTDLKETKQNAVQISLGALRNISGVRCLDYT